MATTPKKHHSAKKLWKLHRNTSDSNFSSNECMVSKTSAPRLANEIINTCHPSHPLFLLRDGPPNYSNVKCNLCQQKLGKIVYHCSLCDFTLDLKCANKSPKLTVDVSKCHDHKLSLLVGAISFTCNACGTCGDGSPYVCTPCFLTFHRSCINLPYVININRHEHRIYRTSSLVFGNWTCEICRKEVNWRYGSYSCKTCPDYVVHSRCATRNDVWNGRELKGVPEKVLDVSPFQVIKDGVINHFSHKHHNLRLIEDVVITNGGESIRCEACTRLIYSGKHYSCMECNFVLHEKCANFPRQKRHGLFTEPLSLHTEKPNLGYFRCDACGRVTNGFVYMSPDRSGLLDVLCAMLSRFSDIHCHSHPLFLTTLDKGTCGACKESDNIVLHCVECKFALDFWCATLPKSIKHKCDDHSLLLRNGKNGISASGTYWCEICETLLDPEEWFYTCDDCGVVCHIECLIGEFANIKPGIVATNDDVEEKLELVPNDRVSRPRCSKCGARSSLPFIFKHYIYGQKAAYFCCSLASQELRYFH